MKRGWSIIISGVSLTIGLALLSTPLLAGSLSFTLGFLACLFSVSLILGTLFLQANKYSEKPEANAGGQTARRLFRGSLSESVLLLLLILGGIITGYKVFRHQLSAVNRDSSRLASIQIQTELAASVRSGQLVYLMGNLLDKVDEELKTHSDRSLSDETIARIAALSYSFRPYRVLQADSLTTGQYSPERGQLLLALAKMGIDSSSFLRIMLQSTFAQAYLPEANLSRAYLRGADLRGAYLVNTNLQLSDLSESDLRTSHLWGAHLRKAKLRRANLHTADLSWADLRNVDLDSAELSGANLESANLKHSSLRSAVVQWANFKGTFLNNADIAGADLWGTNFTRAQFAGADLTGVSFSQSILQEADMTGVNLKDARLPNAIVSEKTWFEIIDSLGALGVEELKDDYRILPTANSSFRLDKLPD